MAPLSAAPASPPAPAPSPAAAPAPPSIAGADIAALEHVAQAWFHLCDDALPEDQRARCQELYPELLSAFCGPRGGVVTAYLCRHIRVAAALTDIQSAAEASESLPERAGGETSRDRMAASSSAIHIECAFGDPVDPKARAILFNCLDLHYRAIEFLTPKPRKICMRMIMGVVTSLLGTLDERSARGHEPVLEPHEVACLEHVIAQARAYYDRSAQRQAQIEYFIGMAGGIVLLGGVLALVGLFETGALLYTPLAGGIGAFVSVLARMTRGQLLLSYESGRLIMRLLGLIRPLLGGIFGAAVFVLLAGGLVTIEVPNDHMPERLFFYVGIAFVAGFSERFAQDMVARVPGGGGAAGAPAPAPAPASAAPPR